MDQGPLAKAEGLRQSVSRTCHQGQCFLMQTTRRARWCHTTLCCSLPPLVRPRVYMRDWAATRWIGRGVAPVFTAAPDIWIRSLKDDESSGLFRCALAEPFCSTECRAVSRVCSSEGRQVDTYLFSAALHFDMHLLPPLVDSLLSQRPASATLAAFVAAIHHGGYIRPQR